MGEVKFPEVIPIPIREDVTVRVLGLPADMTKKEAEKIARVLLAFAHEATND